MMRFGPFVARAVRSLLVLGVAALAGCSGINLGDNPGPDVAKQTGPLTRPPDHLRTTTDPR